MLNNMQNFQNATSEEQADYLAAQTLQDVNQQRLRAQGERDIAKMMLGKKGQVDLSPLMALADSWTGSNMSRGYKAPEDVGKKAMGYQMMANQSDRMADKSQLELLKNIHKDKAASAASKKRSMKPITASAATQLADLRTQYNMADQLYGDWSGNVLDERGGKDSLMGRMSSKAATLLNPGSPEDLYGDNQKRSAQIIGKALEGGKLSDVDYTKYLRFIPGAFDTKEQAEKKVNELKQAMANQHNQMVGTYVEAGFDTAVLSRLDANARVGKKPVKKRTLPKEGEVLHRPDGSRWMVQGDEYVEMK